MSEESYVKVACYECSERISLPVDGVGVAFNCPHCGVDLQMLLKHVCKHCGGRLSFDERPDAIGVQVECGHCHQATVLQPSTFVVDNGGTKTESVTEEEYDEEEYDEEEYDEEGEPEPDVETRRRVGPPQPRSPGRKGMPRPRPPKRAGTGAELKKKESSGGPRKRSGPKRRKGSGRPRPQRPTAQSHPEEESQPVSGPANPGIPSRRIAGATPQSQDVDPMDPMGGVIPSGSPGEIGSAGSGPRQRKVVGTGRTGPKPTFKGASRQEVDDEDGPWYKDKEKKKLAIVAVVFLLIFIPFGLPSVVSIINAGWGNKVDGIVKPWKWFGGDGYRNNLTDLVQVGPLKIESGVGENSISYVVGEANNTSSETFQQVELRFHLFDSSNEILGEAVEYKDEMRPNSTWNFKAACVFTNAVRAEIAEVVVR